MCEFVCVGGGVKVSVYVSICLSPFFLPNLLSLCGNVKSLIRATVEFLNRKKKSHGSNIEEPRFTIYILFVLFKKSL